MNSLPDIEEVKDKSIKKGNNAFRVYRMLPLSERPSKKGRGESLWVWNRCWLRCYYGACIICWFCFYCKVGFFHPAVPWNLGTSLWKYKCKRENQVKNLSCKKRVPIPVWIAQFLNKGASFSTSHPCLAACIQGIWKIFFSWKGKQTGNANADWLDGFSDDFKSLT